MNSQVSRIVAALHLPPLVRCRDFAYDLHAVCHRVQEKPLREKPPWAAVLFSNEHTRVRHAPRDTFDITSPCFKDFSICEEYRHCIPCWVNIYSQPLIYPMRDQKVCTLLFSQRSMTSVAKQLPQLVGILLHFPRQQNCHLVNNLLSISGWKNGHCILTF